MQPIGCAAERSLHSNTSRSNRPLLRNAAKITSSRELGSGEISYWIASTFFLPGRLFDRNAPQSTDLFIDFEPFLTESQEIVKFLYLSLRFAQGSHG